MLHRRRLTADRIEIVTSDVLQWEIPDDLPVVFLYNPFIGEVFQEAMERLFAAYDRRPRPLRIVYSYPWEHNWLISTGRVRAVEVASGLWPPTRKWWTLGEVIVTYAVGESRGVPRPRTPGSRRGARALERPERHPLVHAAARRARQVVGTSRSAGGLRHPSARDDREPSP